MLKKTALAIPVVLLLTLTIASPALSASASFLQRATEHYNRNCKTNPTTLSRQTSLECFLFDRVTELHTSLNLLNTRVNTVETSNASQETRISNLEKSGTSEKALRVFDANKKELGLLADGSMFEGGFYTIYNVPTEKIIKISPSGTLSTIEQAFYQSTNCTGTPYLFDYFSGQLLINYQEDKIGFVDQSSGSVSIDLMKSRMQMNGGWKCEVFSSSGGEYKMKPIISATPPFSLPVKLPLSIRYE
jgi:hypothetical protein